VRYTSWCSQVADGNPRGWWIGSDGTRQGNEVIVPLLIADPESGQTPDQGISISNIYTWISYPLDEVDRQEGLSQNATLLLPLLQVTLWLALFLHGSRYGDEVLFLKYVL
jgi:hypothetical protein